MPIIWKKQNHRQRKIVTNIYQELGAELKIYKHWSIKKRIRVYTRLGYF